MSYAIVCRPGHFARDCPEADERAPPPRGGETPSLKIIINFSGIEVTPFIPGL